MNSPSPITTFNEKERRKKKKGRGEKGSRGKKRIKDAKFL